LNKRQEKYFIKDFTNILITLKNFLTAIEINKKAENAKKNQKNKQNFQPLFKSGKNDFY